MEAETPPVSYLLCFTLSVSLSQSGRSDTFLSHSYPERTTYSRIPSSTSHQHTICVSPASTVIPNIHLYHLKGFPRKSNQALLTNSNVFCWCTQKHYCQHCLSLSPIRDQESNYQAISSSVI